MVGQKLSIEIRPTINISVGILLFPIPALTQTRRVKGEAHRGTWDDDRAASEWLEVHAKAVAKSASSKQRSSQPSPSVVVENLRVLRRESAIQRFKSLLDQSPGIGFNSIQS